MVECMQECKSMNYVQKGTVDTGWDCNEMGNSGACRQDMSWLALGELPLCTVS